MAVRPLPRSWFATAERRVLASGPRQNRRGVTSVTAVTKAIMRQFTRYAKSQGAQVIGQAVGLPPAMTLYSFIGVAVTSASVVLFGEAIWDPVVLLGRFQHRLVASFALVALLIATLNTNVAASVVSPSN